LPDVFLWQSHVQSRSKKGGVQTLIQDLNTPRKAHFLWNHQSRSINSEKVPNMNDANQARLSILRRKQVQARTGLSRSTIYAFIKAGVFPKPVPLGPRAVGWIESEVSNWIATRMQMARGNSKLSK
jgi:prophage regulatory protein